MAKKKSNILISTLVLVLISLVAITALSVVNQITKEPIAQAEANKSAGMYLEIYPSSTKSKDSPELEQMMADSAKLLADNGISGCTIADVKIMDDGGYIIASTSPNGYGGEIKVAIGIKDGKITGFTCLSNNETPGLGANCAEPSFTEQFKEKAAEVLSFTKDGAKNDTEIDAISGATITTKAVTEAVNAAIIFYQANFGGGVQAIEAPDYTEFFEKAYPGANEFEDIEGSEKMLEASAQLIADNGIKACTVEDVKSVNNGEGYVIVATGIGFAKTSPIKIAIGISGDEIKGFTVIEHMETPGYGAECETEEYAKQFVGKKADIIISNTNGSSADNEIDAISGATFTTNAVTGAVNSAVIFYRTNFGNGTFNAEALNEANSVDAVASATATAE